MSAVPKTALAGNPQSPDSVMRNRFYYVISQCMEKRVNATVTIATGEQYIGAVETITKDGIIIHTDRKPGFEGTPTPMRLRDFQTVEFEIEEDRPQPAGKFKRDKEISKAKAPGRRELKKYSPEAPVQITLGDPSTLEKFDQFEANRKLFGVTATFNEDQYTTPLVKPEELTPAQLRQAGDAIKALSHASTLDDAGGEEEERFAAVQGTGRFKQHYPVRTNSSGEIPAFKAEKLAAEKQHNPPVIKNYRQLRDDLVTGKRIHPGLVNDPEGFEALQLAVATFRNPDIADKIVRFKEEREREAMRQKVEELKKFRASLEKKENSAAEVKREPAREVVDYTPASLLDVYLESMGEQHVEFEAVDPYWPSPPEHRASTMPPVRDTSQSLNPHAPAFEFPLALA